MDELKTSRKKRGLKTAVIEPFKQIKLGIYVMATSVVFIFCSGYFFFRAFSKQYENVMEIFGVVDQATQMELITNDIFVENGIILGVLFAAYLIALFVVIFRITHKYYGPLVSIERFVQQIAEGDYRKRVKIRQGDELTRLVEKLNGMAAKLEERHGSQDRRESSEGYEDRAS